MPLNRESPSPETTAASLRQKRAPVLALGMFALVCLGGSQGLAAMLTQQLTPFSKAPPAQTEDAGSNETGDSSSVPDGQKTEQQAPSIMGQVNLAIAPDPMQSSGIDDPVTPFDPAQLTVPEFTPPQLRALGHILNSARPGIYSIRSGNGGNCLHWSSLDGEDANINTASCGAASGSDAEALKLQFAILPVGEPRLDIGAEYAQYTLRRPLGSGWQRARLCATALIDGLVVGPASFGSKLCAQAGPTGEFGPIKPAMQWFNLKHQRGQAYSILFGYRPQSVVPIYETECVALRGGSTAAGTDIIKWRCNGQADQTFELVWQQALPAETEEPLLQSHGWIQSSDGPRRNVPIAGVNIPGGDYTKFNTINDKGAYCASACINNGAQCVA